MVSLAYQSTKEREVPKGMPLKTKEDLYQLLDEYEREVNSSPLASGSKSDYIYFAWVFVRWIDNDFSPGAHVPPTSYMRKVR